MRGWCELAEQSYFFGSVAGDRKYKSDDFAAFFATFLSNGVRPVGTELQVTALDGMMVNLSAGKAIINGRGYYNDDDLVLSFDAADGVLNRVDRIVLRWSRVDRNITAQVIKGTPASSATAPAVVRSEDYYDLGIATVSVPAGASEVISAQITDTRLNTSVCGSISSLITPDTDGWFDAFQTAFDAWFAGLEVTLSGDVAGNLFNLINEITDLQFDAVEVSNALWTADATYADYPYRADVTLTGVTDEMVPDVMLDVEQAVSGEIAPVAIAGTGYIRLYAMSAQGTFTIPVIRVRKAVA